MRAPLPLLLLSACAAHLPPPQLPLAATPAAAIPPAPQPGLTAPPAPLALESWTEPNGLQVHVVRRPGDGEVSVVLALPALEMGADAVDAARTWMLTQRMNGAGIPRAPGSVALAASTRGITIEPRVGPSGTLVSTRCAAADLELALHYLDAAVTRAADPQPTVGAALNASVEKLRDDAVSAASLSPRVLLAQLYGAEVTWGIHDLATELTQLNERELQAQLRTRVAAGGAALFVAGPASGAQIRQLVAATLGRWPAVAAAPPPRSPREALRASRVDVILTGSPIAFLFLALPAPAPDAPERPAAELLAVMLGEGINSSVNRIVRRDASGYFAAAEILQHDAGSTLMLTTAVERWRLEGTAYGVLAELERLSRRPPADADLAAARRRMAGRRLAALETGTSTTAWLADAWLRGRTPQQASADQDRAERAGGDEIQRLVQRVWGARQVALVAVTDHLVGSTLDVLGLGEVTWWKTKDSVTWVLSSASGRSPCAAPPCSLYPFCSSPAAATAPRPTAPVEAAAAAPVPARRGSRQRSRCP